MEISAIKKLVTLSIICYIDSITDHNMRNDRYLYYYNWAKSAIEGNWNGYNFDVIVLLAIRTQTKYNVMGFTQNDLLINHYNVYAKNKNIINDLPLFEDFEKGGIQFLISELNENPKLINPYLVITGILDFISWFDQNQNNLDKAILKCKAQFKSFNIKPSYPTIATFCKWIKESGHYKNIGISSFIKDDKITHREKYVKEICEYYNLTYNVRIIKGDWSENDRLDYYEKIKETIYPKIDNLTITTIDNYIESKKMHQ
jgi:hypothetical protein